MVNTKRKFAQAFYLILLSMVIFIPGVITKDPYTIYPDRPIKVKPADRGGSKVHYTDKDVYTLIEH